MAAVLVAAVLVGAGCGGGDESSSSSEPRPVSERCMKAVGELVEAKRQHQFTDERLDSLLNGSYGACTRRDWFEAHGRLDPAMRRKVLEQIWRTICKSPDAFGNEVPLPNFCDT